METAGLLRGGFATLEPPRCRAVPTLRRKEVQFAGSVFTLYWFGWHLHLAGTYSEHLSPKSRRRFRRRFNETSSCAKRRPKMLKCVEHEISLHWGEVIPAFISGVVH